MAAKKGKKNITIFEGLYFLLISSQGKEKCKLTKYVQDLLDLKKINNYLVAEKG